MGHNLSTLFALCLLPLLAEEPAGPFECLFGLHGDWVVPPVSTPGRAWVSAGFEGPEGGGWCQTDVTERPLQVQIHYENLKGTPVGADIHVGMPGENGPLWRGLFPGYFPSGSIASLEFQTDVCDTLLAFEVMLYVVVRTDSFPDGELRGPFLCTQIDPVKVSTWGRLRTDFR